MLFNSIEFTVFLSVLFFLYWFVAWKNLIFQNILLLFAGYFFYAWWDWRFLVLLISLALSNYYLGIRIDNARSRNKGKRFFLAGLLINLGVLIIFKYYDFFISGFAGMVARFGYELPVSTLNLVLPLGLSFYVFLSLSYIIDIYRENLKAETNVIDVLLTLGFFPILLAGPVQRPSTLLPQVKIHRVFDYSRAVDGLKQILWGLFAKVVVADQVAKYADDIFSNYPDYSGSTLALGAFFFAVQIYADFSGYSNIAIGTARLLGFNLMQNFAYPYFSRDITEFWKRWHISLTTWFRDYVFLPLSFSISSANTAESFLFLKKDHFIYIVASVVTWSLTGLWHGADSTFIVWGLFNGILLIIYHLQSKPRKKILKRTGISNNNIIVILLESGITLFLVLLLWVIFRSESIMDSLQFISKIFSGTLFTLPEVRPKIPLLLIVVFFAVEWAGRGDLYAIASRLRLSRPFRWAFYYGIVLTVLWFAGDQHDFIYFQF